MIKKNIQIVFLLLISFTYKLSAQPFTPGNLSVLQINGTSSAAASPVTICEYNTSTLNQSSPISSWPLPSGGGSNNLTLSGSAGSDGNMTLDSERINLIVPGYNAAAFTSNVVSASGINRVVFAFDPFGNYSMVSNVPQSQAFNGNNFRSATGAGSRFYGAGAGGGTNGVRIMGATTSTQVVASGSTRVVQIFNGQLYYSLPGGIYTAGAGIPIASGTSSTLVASATSANSYAVSPDNNTLYVADDGAGIIKYTRTIGSGLFTTGPALSSIPCRGITVDFTTTPYIIYATTAPATGVNALIRLTDGSSVVDTLAVAAIGTIFRGLTFSPGNSAKLIGGGTNICSGTATSLTFYGNPGDSITYSINGVNNGLRLGNNGVNVLNTGALTALGTDSVYAYSLVSITGSVGTVSVSGSATITVSPSIPAPFSGSLNVCQGGTFSLSDITPGGSWSSSDPSIASISASTGSGVGVTSGATTITYSLTNVCGGIIRTSTITVNPLPAGGGITGPTSVCAGSIITLSNTTSVGTGSWSTTSTLATINSSTGSLVAGLTSGNAIITYTATTALCGSTTLTTSITINSRPNPGSITGADSVCAGSTTTLTSSGTSGGNWISANPSIATVNSFGIVGGVSAASVAIRYKVTTPTCGSDSVQKNILVKPLPNAGSIAGPSSVCTGSVITLTNATSIGTGSWSTASSLATINSSTGVLTAGSSSGNATITYTATTPSCGSTTLTTNITINPLPNAGVITGTDSVCAGSTISLTSTGTSGGTWISTNTSVATVNSAGNVSGLVAGSVIIRYKVTTPTCGSDSVQKSILVRPLPNAGSIGGSSSVCAGSSITLTNSGSVGVGSWSSLSSLVTIGATNGHLTAGASTGTATITYTATTSGCGSTTTTTTVVVNALPDAGTLTGLDSVCVAGTTSLATTGTTAGTWTSLNPAIATVTGSGVVGGVLTGNATIKYKVTTATCGADSINKVIHVNPLPLAGSIGGPSFVCAGSAVTLTNSGSSGVGQWSTTSSLASVNTISGMVTTGSSSGVASITYTASTYSCGSATTNTNVTINSLPNAGVITGADSVCAGSTISLLSSGTSGGTWISGNNSIATVNASGVVYGVSTGSVAIRYKVVTPTCGSDSVSKIVVVNSLSNSGAISGVSNVCAGNIITLTNTGSVGVGTWSSSSALVSVNPTSGAVTASTTAGVATITYSVYTYSCGSSSSYYPITINPLPFSGIITGTDTLCPGNATTLLASGVTGGTWTSSNPLVATVNVSGTVFAVASGAVTIKYKVTTPTCGSDSASFNMYVRPLPTAGTIVGSGTVCTGFTITLTDAVPGGIWTTSTPTVATVAGGVVTGLLPGTAIISYSVTNLCTTAITTATVTVTPAAITPITGTTTVCVGSNISLSNATIGGTWQSANIAVASVTATGVVGGVSQGSTLISYTVLNTCGVITVTVPVLVNPLPVAGVITSTSGSVVCSGAQLTLTNATPGGVWSSSNTAVAGVSPTGVVSGNSFGSAVIYYTVTNGCGSAFDTIMLSVNTAPVSGGIPQITTTSPSWVCAGAMYQNFGTSAAASTGSYYQWSVTNCQLYATGTGSQYCLVNFLFLGEATVYLATYSAGNICPVRDTFKVEVANSAIDHPVVTYTGGRFECNPDQSSYQWGYDDKLTLEPTILSGETSKYYDNASPDFASKYYWVITNHLLCEQKSYFSVPVNVIDLTQPISYSITLYPNPSNGIVSIKVSSVIEETGTISVSDITGREVLSSPFETNKITALQSGQPAGVYLVTIRSKHITYTTKMVIQ